MRNSDLISRSALLVVPNVCKVTEYDEAGFGMSYLAVPVEAVENAPAVDAVEVIRCKDCKAFGESPWGHFRMGWCIIHGCHHAPDYFCASAKEKEKVEVEYEAD